MSEVIITKPDRTATFIALSSICFLLTVVLIYISTFLDGFGRFVYYSTCACTHLAPNLEILKWIGIYIGRILLIILPADGVRFGILGMQPSPTLDTIHKVGGLIIILLNSVLLIAFLLISLDYLSFLL